MLLKDVLAQQFSCPVGLETDLALKLPGLGSDVTLEMVPEVLFGDPRRFALTAFVALLRVFRVHDPGFVLSLNEKKRNILSLSCLNRFLLWIYGTSCTVPLPSE